MLRSKSDKKPPHKLVSTVKRLGIIRQRYSQPLFHVLRDRVAKNADSIGSFTLIDESPSILAQKLHQDELDAAFLSPIDYALRAEQYRILPGIGLISAGESRSVQLLFRERLQKIRSIAVNPRVSASDVVLASLVLAEKFQLSPQIIPVSSSLSESLDKSDATLITGDDVFILQDFHRLDLVDEWSDITGMPYVHGVWITTLGRLTDSEVHVLTEVTERGISEYQFTDPQQKWYEEHFGYYLHEDAVHGFSEFLSMAYYHGILKEIIVPRFFEATTPSRN